MSRVIRISNELYELLENTTFKNGVGIQHLADEVIKAGLEQCKNTDVIVKERGRDVKITW